MMLITCRDDEAALLLHYFESRLLFSTFLVLSKENLHFLEMVSWDLLRCVLSGFFPKTAGAWGICGLKYIIGSQSLQMS